MYTENDTDICVINGVQKSNNVNIIIGKFLSFFPFFSPFFASIFLDKIFFILFLFSTYNHKYIQQHKYKRTYKVDTDIITNMPLCQ